jgi:hypothetical protein
MKMMRELIESLTTPLPYRKIRDTSSEIRYGFIYNDFTFFVEFYIKQYPTANTTQTMATVVFFEIDEDGNMVMGQTNKFKFPMQLFSTVLAIVQENINKWDYIAFTAMESGGLVGLYNTIVKKYATEPYHANRTDTDVGTLYIIGKQKLSKDIKQLLAVKAEQIIRDKQNG